MVAKAMTNTILTLLSAELPPGPVLVMIGRVFAEVAAVMPRESGASSTPQGPDETSTSITNVR